MRDLLINPKFIISNDVFKFVEISTMYKGFFDVMYNGERIAILNGLSSPLQWTVKNGSNIPIKIIEQLEDMVMDMIIESNK